VIRDAHPELSHGTYPANETSWHYTSHEIIDLERMQICGYTSCLYYPPHPIARLTPDHIILYERPGIVGRISRRTWRFEQRAEDMGRVSETTGQCRRGDFSGFPERHPDNNSGDTTLH
jgi:hypothetical protein